ncbi:MAG: phospholipase D-like domain-containing protein [Actinomycetia bacterium]|nr:phospholipase D-like domain-containing protein [Actinomycetes bacterium]
MHYLKRNTKFSILAFLIIVLSITISISTLAKTEVYFSLSDNPQKEIIKNINQAQAFINIAMYVFTDKELALPLVDAQERGVKVRVYLDKEQVDYQYSQSSFLVQKGIKTRISTNNYIMHHKFAIIDNRILLTGSYNWTFSANHRNDENLMVIDDPEIIKIFQNQFINLWTNKYSLERTRQLYEIAKIDFLPTSPSPTSPKPEVQIIDINTASQNELIKILKISEPIARKIIALRDELGGFKEPQALTQLPEITNLEWEEWKEEGIIITVN